MFNGRLDDKGRVKVSAQMQRFLESLPEKKFFVTSLDRRTAAIYPIASWRATEQFFENFTENPQLAEDVHFTATTLGSEVEMDGQGRILFNSDLRRVVKLEGNELHLYWYLGHVEVLTDEIYKEREQSAVESAINAASATVKTPTALRVLRKAGLK